MISQIGYSARRTVARMAFNVLKAVGAAVNVEHLNQVVEAGAGMHAWPDLGLYKNQAKVYSESAYVYTAVNPIIKIAAQMQFKVNQVSAKGEKHEIANHPFLVLMRNPNPWLSQFKLMEQTFLFNALNGNTYWFVAVGNSGQPEELYLLRPDRIRIVPGDTAADFIRGYVYTVGGQDIPLDAFEVMQWKKSNPADDYYGLSPLKPLANKVASETGMTDWNSNFFGRDRATPAGIVDVPQFTSKTDFERIKEDWRQSFGSTKRRTAFIRGGGVQYTPMGMSHVDMDFVNGLVLIKEDILNAYGVPPGMIDKNATEANANAGYEYFTSRTMWPLAIDFCQQATTFFSRWYGEDVEIGVEDFRVKDALVEYQEVKAYGSYLTADEVREQYLNKQPLPNGMGAIPVDGALAVAVTGQQVGRLDAPPKPGTTVETITDQTDAQKLEQADSKIKALLESLIPVRLSPLVLDASSRRELAQFVKYAAKDKPYDGFRFNYAPVSSAIAAKAFADVCRLDELELITNKAGKTPNRVDQSGIPDPNAEAKDKAESVLADKVGHYFQGLQTDLARAVRHISASRKAVADQAAYDDYFNAQFWQEQLNQLVAALSGQIQDNVLNAAIDTAALMQMKFGIGTDGAAFHPQAAQYALDHTDSVLAGFNTTTQKGVGALISRWVNTDGATLQDLVDAIQQSALFNPARAELVAATEVTRTYAAGSYMAVSEAADAAGVDMALGLDDVGSLLPVHPNCRCWVVPTPKYDDSEKLVSFDMTFKTSADERVCIVCGPMDGQLASDLVAGDSKAIVHVHAKVGAV